MNGGFGPKIMFSLGGINITETVVNTWIIMAVLIIVSFLVTRRFERLPRGAQNAIEALVEGIEKLTVQTMGKKNIRFTPYIGTLMIFLACANLSGLVGIRPPTADVNTTIGLALITFVMIHFFGIKTQGLGKYLKGFLEPFPAMLPLNLIGELATPISLGFRLFGNIVGGLIIMSLVYKGLSLGMSIPVFQAFIPVPLHMYFDVFAGLLQSFIFAMLTMVFVSGSIE